MSECHCNIETGDLESLRKTCPVHGRKRGRPRTGGRYTIQQHIFLDAETKAYLAALAQDYGLNESQVIRKLIKAEYERREGLGGINAG